jgi:hypothetical protein
VGKQERVELIKKIQEERNSYILSYVTSTRQNLEVPMAMDSIRKIYDHLQLIGKSKKEIDIDLFIHSNGGDGIVPWRLVSLIREYADKFSVLIPHRAFSAATLTALGADRVVMHPMGMLGPTDPTVTNSFNPPDPANPSQRVGISVEDVTAYIAFVKEDVGITHQDELVQAFNKLADQVHPLALGNVKRSLSQSRMMAKNLLALHMDIKDQHKINEIVDSLTSKLFYHGHPINRNEAKEQVGLPMIEFPSPTVEELMWQLYLDYEQQIKMEEPFAPLMEFSDRFHYMQPGQVSITPSTIAKLVYVESDKRTDVYSIDYQVAGQKTPEGFIQANTIFRRSGWSTE